MIFKYSLRDYYLFSEALLFLAVSRLILIFLPFKIIAPFIGKLITKEDTNPANTVAILDILPLQKAIARGCRYSFWRTKCFEQALAAKMLLKRRGLPFVLYFGVLKDEKEVKLNAHAWVSYSGTIISGNMPNLESYTIVSRFKG